MGLIGYSHRSRIIAAVAVLLLAIIFTISGVTMNMNNNKLKWW